MQEYYDPVTLVPPHRITRPEQVTSLAEDMSERGWQGASLVGYKLDGGIQLLSGTHRRAAAIAARVPAPVKVYDYETVVKAWGTDGWFDLMNGQY